MNLSIFHVIDGFPPDLAHDVVEGFAVDLLSNILVRFLGKNILL